MRKAMLAAVSVWALAGLSVPVCSTAQAQSVARTELQAKRETASKMLRPVSISFDNHRLEDVMSFIQQLTGADMEVMWIDDHNSDGLDKDATVTVEVKDVTALVLLEKVLAKSQTDTLGGGNSWQMADTGAIQIGPKARLNPFRRVEIYDINDLLLEIPDYDNAPEFDLAQVLQRSGGGGGGGGGGQSPFQDSNDSGSEDRVPRSERAEEMQSIITELVEFEQWVDNGGDAATIRYWQGSFIVNAPDYVHRQLGGYAWWPSRRASGPATRERRYVTLDGSYENANIDGFVPYPATGTVGGGGPGGGGGGGGGPPPGGG